MEMVRLLIGVHGRSAYFGVARDQIRIYPVEHH